VTGGLLLVSLLMVCLLSVSRHITTASPASLPISCYLGVTPNDALPRWRLWASKRLWACVNTLQGKGFGVMQNALH